MKPLQGITQTLTRGSQRLRLTVNVQIGLPGPILKRFIKLGDQICELNYTGTKSVIYIIIQTRPWLLFLCPIDTCPLSILCPVDTCPVIGLLLCFFAHATWRLSPFWRFVFYKAHSLFFVPAVAIPYFHNHQATCHFLIAGFHRTI